jgi:hypothetical protein
LLVVETGFEAFDTDDKSLGMFPSQPAAAKAIEAGAYQNNAPVSP